MADFAKSAGCARTIWRQLEQAGDGDQEAYDSQQGGAVHGMLAPSLSDGQNAEHQDRQAEGRGDQRGNTRTACAVVGSCPQGHKQCTMIIETRAISGFLDGLRNCVLLVRLRGLGAPSMNGWV